jgi:ATP-dependent DNA helicase RecQ
MLAVSGVGENKFERYGEQFIRQIQEFTGGQKEKLYFGEVQDLVETPTRTVKRQHERSKKEPFFLTPAQAVRFSYKERYFAAELAVELNRLADLRAVEKLSGKAINDFLVENEYAVRGFSDARWNEEISEKGQQIGLFIGTRISQKGKEYNTVCFGEQAQKFFVKHYTKTEL